jgi:iron complex transport system substrate-binding protein
VLAGGVRNEADPPLEEIAAQAPDLILSLYNGTTEEQYQRFEPGESIVRTGNDARAQFFADLGFVVPTEVAGIRPDEYGEIAVSDELIGELSRDLLVWNVGFSPEERASVESNPLYPTLPAVQEGRVLWIEDPVVSGAFGWGTVLSLDYALEELVPQIAETVG